MPVPKKREMRIKTPNLETISLNARKFLGKPLGDIQCPVCGYYCLGNGGIGCIDKPGMFPKSVSGRWGK